MLGYATSTGSYRLWDMTTNKLVIGRHLTFNEASVLKQIKLIEISDSEAALNRSGGETNNEDTDADDDLLKDDDSLGDSDTASDGQMIHDTNLDGAGNRNATTHDVNLDSNDIVNSVKKDCTGNIDRDILRKGERNRRPPERFGEWAEMAHFALSAEQFVENDPTTIDEAKNRDDWPQWKEAIQSECKSLTKNETWKVCDLPKDRKAITNKWVFKLKRKADGQIDKYKARLVARGFTQKFGFDYNETYAPVAKLVTVRILLVIANQMGMHIHQMDVKCAFLNGELNEDIYMEVGS